MSAQEKAPIVQEVPIAPIPPSKKKQAPIPPKSNDGTTKSNDGIPKSSDGIPKSSDGIPKSSDGTTKSSGGIPKSNDGIPKSNDGIPKSSDGIPTIAQSNTADGGVPKSNDGPKYHDIYLAGPKKKKVPSSSSSSSDEESSSSDETTSSDETDRISTKKKKLSPKGKKLPRPKKKNIPTASTQQGCQAPVQQSAPDHPESSDEEDEGAMKVAVGGLCGFVVGTVTAAVIQKATGLISGPQKQQEPNVVSPQDQQETNVVFCTIPDPTAMDHSSEGGVEYVLDDPLLKTMREGYQREVKCAAGYSASDNDIPTAICEVAGAPWVLRGGCEDMSEYELLQHAQT